MEYPPISPFTPKNQLLDLLEAAGVNCSRIKGLDTITPDQMKKAIQFANEDLKNSSYANRLSDCDNGLTGNCVPCTLHTISKCHHCVLMLSRYLSSWTIPFTEKLLELVELSKK